MDAIMENRVIEEKIDLAKRAIERGQVPLADIAEILGLPLPFVEDLAKAKPS